MQHQQVSCAGLKISLQLGMVFWEALFNLLPVFQCGSCSHLDGHITEFCPGFLGLVPENRVAQVQEICMNSNQMQIYMPSFGCDGSAPYAACVLMCDAGLGNLISIR